MNEVAKAQWVRLWDVFGLTPLMMYIGWRHREMSPLARTFLMGAGAWTLVYNLKNYLSLRDIRRESYHI